MALFTVIDREIAESPQETRNYLVSKVYIRRVMFWYLSCASEKPILGDMSAYGLQLRCTVNATDGQVERRGNWGRQEGPQPKMMTQLVRLHFRVSVNRKVAHSSVSRSGLVMEGLGAAGALVNICTTAISSVKFLYGTIDNIKNAPDTVMHIKTDLQAVEKLLDEMSSQSQGLKSKNLEYDGIAPAVKICDSRCKAFSQWLENCVRHPTANVSKMDRLRVVWGQERIKSFNKQLTVCKGTLTVALTVVSV